LLKYLAKWLRLDYQSKLIFIEAYVSMGFSRFQVLSVPFKEIACHLGTIGEPDMEPPTDPALIR
jgi:hypothetical protein